MALARDELKELLKEKGVKSLDDFNAFTREVSREVVETLLDGEVLDTLVEAKVLVEGWRREYNRFRPHCSLGDLTPRQFVDKYKSSLRSPKTPFLAGPVLG